MSQEINLAVLKEITFSALKEEMLNDNDEDTTIIDEISSLQASHDVLKVDVDQQLALISMLNDLAVIAENLAEKQKKDADSEQKKEYQEKFQKVQQTIMNEIDVPEEFVQLLQVASAGGVEALGQVATWARRTAKELRNDEEFNQKLDTLQSQEKKLQDYSKIAMNNNTQEDSRFSLRKILNKAFRTNSSEEEYRLQLTRLERTRQEDM